MATGFSRRTTCRTSIVRVRVRVRVSGAVFEMHNDILGGMAWKLVLDIDHHHLAWAHARGEVDWVQFWVAVQVGAGTSIVAGLGLLRVRVYP